jgi:hypothetical protein
MFPRRRSLLGSKTVICSEYSETRSDVVVADAFSDRPL